MNYETFLQDLHAARDRAQRFRRHAQEQDSAALALEELDVTLEELRVAEEEVRVQEALDDGRAEGELDRQHFQALFLLAPAPYLVTDRAGVIRQATCGPPASSGSTAGSWPASPWPPSSTPATGRGSAAG